MTTLAEMTPEQREQCKGMWCEITWGGAGKTDLGVLLYLGVCRYHGDEVGCLWVPSIVDGDVYPLANQISLNTLTPRPDLPRAWQPDGTPADMDVETGIVRSHPRGGVIGSYESPEYVDQPEGTVMTRFVGEWEEA